MTEPLVKIGVLLTEVGHAGYRPGGPRYYARFQFASSSDKFELSLTKAEYDKICDKICALGIDGSPFGFGVALEMTICPKTVVGL